jgi:hypothetical protein
MVDHVLEWQITNWIRGIGFVPVGFLQGESEIKNGLVRMNNFKVGKRRKGRGVGLPPFLTPKP